MGKGLTCTLFGLSGCAALPGCGTAQGDAVIADLTHAGQAAAVAAGQPWLAPVIGAAGTLAVGLMHAFVGKGIPGVPTIPGTPAHYSRLDAIAEAERNAPTLD
jgi:hypothetical protein